MKPKIAERNLLIAKEYLQLEKTTNTRFDGKALEALAKKHDLTIVAIRSAVNYFTKTTRVLTLE